jgi:hypothetical protein
MENVQEKDSNSECSISVHPFLAYFTFIMKFMWTLLYLREPEASPVQQASSEQSLVQDSSGTK